MKLNWKKKPGVLFKKSNKDFIMEWAQTKTTSLFTTNTEQGVASVFCSKTKIW